MFNEKFSISKMNFGMPSLASFRRRNSRMIPPWIPRRPVLGIEIDGTSLLLACVKLGLGRVQLARFGAIPDFAALSPQELHGKLREFLKVLGGEEPVVALGLPRREVIVRFLNLPAAARKSFQEAVALQVEMYKPTDAEKFDWDTAIIDEQQRLATTLVLAPHTTVEKFANLFSQAEYPITRLTVTQFSLLHLFLRVRQASDTTRCLMLDCREGAAELALLEGRRLVYSRSFPLNEESATAAHEVLAEIRQAFSSLRWNESDSQVVLLSGAIPASVQAALAAFGPVERLEGRIRLHGFPEQTDLQKYLGVAAVALSNLTSRHQPYCLNLLPAELRPARRRLRNLPTYALLVANAIFLIAIGLRVPVQNYALLRQYRKEIASVKVRADEMKLLLQKNRAMREELLALYAFQQRGRQPLDALNEIAQKLPQDAWLNIFSCRKGQIDLGGSAKAASPLLPLFQSSPQFQEVKFNGALSQDASGAEHFRMHIRLKEKP